MQSFTISENDAGQRLDKFLRKLLPNAAFTLIYKINRTNKVKVNRKRQDNEYKLQVGEVVEIFLTDEDWKKLSRKKKVTENSNVAKFDKSWVMFEDSDILVVNKPAGLNVHPGDHKSAESSLIQMVQDYLGEHLKSLTFQPSLVHRIDRDTSGAIIIAKTKPALLKMLELLQGHTIEKRYLAITVGEITPRRGTIKKKLLRTTDEERKGSDKVIVSDAGQPAVTHYETLKEKLHEKYSALECRIETGRMHQIRVHLQSCGVPILGDRLYGNLAENGFAKRELEIGRQMLHAWKLTFPHPIKTGRIIELKARIPADMQKILGEFGSAL